MKQNSSLNVTGTCPKKSKNTWSKQFMVLALLFAYNLSFSQSTNTTLLFENGNSETASIDVFPEITGAYTVELYLNWEGTGSIFPCIWQFAIGTSNYPTSLWINSGRLEFWDPGSLTATSSNVIQACTWYHIAYVWDGTTGKIFVDGVELASHTGRNSIPGNDRFIIGDDTGTETWYFNGKMDEIRISDTARYTTNFTSPTGELILDSNTLALYHFNETTGQIAADASANGLDLTLGTTSNVDANDPTFSDSSNSSSCNPLGINDFSVLNGIQIFEESETLVVKSENKNIESIVIYDLLGRTIFSKNQINSERLYINTVEQNKKTLFIKIKLVDGKQKIVKVIF